MTAEVLQKIISNTFTKQDFYARLAVVEECLEKALFTSETETDTTHRTALITDFARQTGRGDMAAFIEGWGDDVLNSFTASDLYLQMEELKSSVESLPTLVLYAPVLLKNEDMVDVGKWSREQFDPRVMIDLMVDPKALGGCAFVWEGEYYDYSLNYFFNKKEAEIVELIRSYESE